MTIMEIVIGVPKLFHTTINIHPNYLVILVTVNVEIYIKIFSMQCLCIELISINLDLRIKSGSHFQTGQIMY